MESLTLEHFIPDYPLQTDRDIQFKIAQHTEFYVLEGKSKETLTGELYKHQKINVMYLSQYDRIFNINETGTGKTPTLIAAAEYFKKHKEYNIKRTIILVPGRSLGEEFKSQILRFTGSDDYLTESVETAKTEAARKGIITKQINKWYGIYGYQEFSNLIEKKSLFQIEEEFSDTLFFLDEVHELRNVLDERDTEASSKYNNIWKVLHIAKRIKVMIATATPMVNRVNDFVPLANLLLPADKQLPTNINYSYTSLNQIQPYLNGLISYVRSLDIDIDTINHGEPVNDTMYEIEVGDDNNFEILPIKKQIIGNDIVFEESNSYNFKTKIINIPSQSHVYKLEMEEYQASVYLKKIQTRSGSFEHDEKVISNAVFIRTDNSSNSNKYSLAASRKFITIDKDVASLTPSYKKLMLGDNSRKTILSNIRKSSIKYGFICENEDTLYNEKNGKPGKSFIYIEYVNGGGAYYLGQMLELLGYSRYTSGGISFKDNEVIVDTKRITKKKRYALLTGNMSNYGNVMELFNSRENIDGEYIQIIIASKVAKMGLNFNNTLREYLVSSDWHEAGMHQASSRIFRAVSYNWMLERGDNIKVDVYRLAAVLPKKSKIQTIDIKLYMIAEMKDIETKLYHRNFKKIAYDGILNYRRNVRDSDIPYTKDTDYDEKYYELINGKAYPDCKSKVIGCGQGPTKYQLTNNTYRIFHSEDIIERISNEILKILNAGEMLTFDQIKEELQIGDFVFSNALINLLSKNRYIYNEYYQKRYINISGNSIYLSNLNNINSVNAKTKSGSSSRSRKEVMSLTPSYYSELILTDEEIFYDYSQIEKSKEWIEELVEKFSGREYKESVKELVKITKLPQQKLFELFEYTYINDRTNPIIDLFKFYYLESYIYKELIKHANYLLFEKKFTGKGRKADIGAKSRLKDGFKDYDKIFNNYYLEEEAEEEIVFHFFPKTIKGSKSYGFSDIFTKSDRPIRIFEEKTNSFRDASIAEESVYNWVITSGINNTINKISDGGKTPFGIYTFREGEFEGKLRILNLQKKSKGIDCNSLKVHELLELNERLFNENIENIGDKRTYCNELRKRLDKMGKLINIL